MGSYRWKYLYRGKLQEPLTERTKARLLYSRGKIAGSCLLLETVLQLSRELSLQRSQVIAGTFVMNELLELPAAWPGCREVLATAASLQVQDCPDCWRATAGAGAV